MRCRHKRNKLFFTKRLKDNKETHSLPASHRVSKVALESTIPAGILVADGAVDWRGISILIQSLHFGISDSSRYLQVVGSLESVLAGVLNVDVDVDVLARAEHVVYCWAAVEMRG